MASYTRVTAYTDQGPERQANYEISTHEADLVAIAIEHALETSEGIFRAGELIELSRVKAVLDAGSDWVESGDDDD